MNKLILSQTGIYRLHQLASQVRSISGVRHRIADQADMLDLLRHSASSGDEVIRRLYANFVAELDDEQRASLAARGLR